MNLQDYERLLRNRWMTIFLTAMTILAGTAIYTFIQTPMYEASTRLFVSTSGSSISDMYQGNRFSQERVVSYAELVKGQTLAQRTIDKLGLEMNATDLRENIKATSKPNTVLIYVDVLDESPVRARDIANALSDEFVLMVRELETPRPGSEPDARVTVEQRAEIPDEPVSPKIVLNLVSGLGFGLAAGVALAFARDRLDNTVKDQRQLEEISNTGVVGTIPLDKLRRDHPAIAFDEERSAIAEAFRKLRTNLQFLAVDNPPRVLVITSSTPNEGKSVTSINIALALAEAGRKVLLVDADLRRPSVHHYLDMVGTVGLSTVLSGGVPLAEALQVSKFSNLTVLAAGVVPPNPSELLGSHAAENLFQMLREQFDYVIIDSPPVLAVTDANVVAGNSDGALVVVRFGTTKIDDIERSFHNVRSVGAEPLGAVLTMVPQRGFGSYGYGYGYGYGPDAHPEKGDSLRRPRHTSLSAPPEAT